MPLALETRQFLGICKLGSTTVRRSQYDRNYRAMISYVFGVAIFRQAGSSWEFTQWINRKQSSRDKILRSTYHRGQKNPRGEKRTQNLLGGRSKTLQPREEIVATPPPVTDNIPKSATDAVRPNFIADPEPVPRGRAFLCKFTLSRPGLVGLNKLAIYLNDLEDSGSISGWQASGWDDAATKLRALIGFATRADAITAIKSVP